MRLGFIFFLMLGFYGGDWRMASGQVATPIVPPRPTLYVPQVTYQPRVIYQPQTVLVPYQYDRSEVIRRDYRTPLRDMMFGRYRQYDYYRSPEQR